MRDFRDKMYGFRGVFIQFVPFEKPVVSANSASKCRPRFSNMELRVFEVDWL